MPAAAAPNVPLCFALAEQFNQCQRQAQRQSRYGGYGGYGGGYYGGYHDGWDGGGYGYGNPYGGRHRAQAKQAQCAQILVAMQQNRCAN